MIPNEILRISAARTCESYVSGLLSDYDPEYRYEFSAGFEKKINRLKRRADHPVFYRTTRRIAVFILALLASGMIWIAIDTDARAAFFGWFGKTVGTYFSYHNHQEGSSRDVSDDGAVEYRPMWLPEGYSEYMVISPHQMTTVVYINDDEKVLSFSYLSKHDTEDMFLDISQVVMEETVVGDYPAVLFLSQAEDVSSAVSWTDSNNNLFVISGFVSDSDLLKIAENVRQISG